MCNICPADVEEGVGNAHPNHVLPNSNSTTKGEEQDASSDSGGGGEGDDEEKSVLQVRLVTWIHDEVVMWMTVRTVLRDTIT